MKKLITVLLAAALIFALSAPVFAINGAYTFITQYKTVLDEKETDSLDRELSELYSVNYVPLFIVTKENYEQYTVTEFADYFYNSNPPYQFTEHSDSACGFLFADDFDNDTFMLYRVGEAFDIITDDELSQFYDDLNTVYKPDDMPATYSYIADYVSAQISEYYGKNPVDNSSEYTGSPYYNADGSYSADYDYSAPATNGTNVNDDAGLLTDEQEKTLLAKIDEIKAKYNFDVVLHTTNSIGSKTIADYADDYYDYNDFGCGENNDGLLFMLNMNNGEEGNRDYYTSTCGYGITAFKDYAILDSDSAINSRIVEYLKDGEYYKAFTEYLTLVDLFLNEATTNEPFSYGHPYLTASDYLTLELIALVIALIIAAVISLIVKSGMKTNELKGNAVDYKRPGSLVVRNSLDFFSHSVVTKTVHQSSDSDSGSSTHSSSSGTSHGGGGGKF